MTHESVHRLLDGINAIRDQTDLDLLLFSFRHPHALLTVDQLAAAVGHDRARVEASLAALIAAGLLGQLQRPTRQAYIFAFRPDEEERTAAVTSLLEIASSRSGRLALLEALHERATTTLHQRKA
jgi:predicted transcriptional regulator